MVKEKKLEFNDLNSFHYPWPSKAVALVPAKERSAAKLLFYCRETEMVGHYHFSDLPKLLPPRSVIVFNNTRVRPAKLVLTKETGGQIPVMVLGHTKKEAVMIAPQRLILGQRFLIKIKQKRWLIEVVGQIKNEYKLRILTSGVTWSEILITAGLTPLPPYLKGSPLVEKDRRRLYQTVFSKKEGSLAAPTASLHFDQKLINQLKKAGHTIVFVTLHVGLGTFASLTENNFKINRLHAEKFEVPTKTIKILQKARLENRPIIAVGTTALRTLETIGKEKLITSQKGETRLFIRRPYKFKLTAGLITNFHVPKSSLLLLIDAFINKKGRWRELYEVALAKDYKFFSFGDGMLII